MPATSIWDGTIWQPIQGLEGADGTDGQDGATGPQGDKGDQGDTGPPGPSSVSTDAGNQSTLGSDSLIYTPDFASGTYLPLTGGTLTGNLIIHRDGTDRPSIRLQHNEGVARVFDIKFIDDETVSLGLDLIDAIQVRSPSVVSFHGSGTEFNQQVDHKNFQIVNVPSVWGSAGQGLGLVASFQAGDGVGISTQEGTAAQFFDVGISMFKPMQIHTSMTIYQGDTTSFAPTQNALIPAGTNQTAQYFGVGLGTAATGAIESAWIGGQPTLAIGNTRDSKHGYMTFNFDNSIKMFAGVTQILSTGGAFPLGFFNINFDGVAPVLRRSGASGEVFYDSSTRRNKTDIEPLTIDAGSLVDSLKPMSFVMKNSLDVPLWGFLAEDIDDTIGVGITYESDGLVANYENRILLALYAKELQELRGRVKTLENA